MDNHDKIAGLIKQGRLDLTYVHGTRRSGSTIIEIVFSQRLDRARHQPFRMVASEAMGVNESREGFIDELYDRACAVVLRDAATILETRDQASILVKEVSAVMPLALFARWAELPSRFIITYRDPRSQFVSLARALYAEDQSAETLPEMGSFIRDVLPSWESMPLRTRGGQTLIEIFKRIWVALPEEVALMSGPQIALVESAVMRSGPEKVLNRAVGRLGLPAFDMVNLFGATDKVQFGRPINPFIRRAVTSTRIDPLSPDDAIDPGSLPAKSAAAIAEIEPIYLDLLGSPKNV